MNALHSMRHVTAGSDEVTKTPTCSRGEDMVTFLVHVLQHMWNTEPHSWDDGGKGKHSSRRHAPQGPGKLRGGVALPGSSCWSLPSGCSRRLSPTDDRKTLKTNRHSLANSMGFGNPDVFWAPFYWLLCCWKTLQPFGRKQRPTRSSSWSPASRNLIRRSPGRSSLMSLKPSECHVPPPTSSTGFEGLLLELYSGRSPDHPPLPLPPQSAKLRNHAYFNIIAFSLASPQS